MREYGGVEIPIAELRTMDSSRDILEKAEAIGLTLYKAFYRDNGIVNVNGGYDQRFCYLTLEWDGEGFVLLDVDLNPAGSVKQAIEDAGGFYLAAHTPQVADYPTVIPWRTGRSEPAPTTPPPGESPAVSIDDIQPVEGISESNCAVSCPYSRVFSGERVGLIDDSGNIVVEPQYTEIMYNGSTGAFECYESNSVTLELRPDGNRDQWVTINYDCNGEGSALVWDTRKTRTRSLQGTRDDLVGTELIRASLGDGSGLGGFGLARPDRLLIVPIYQDGVGYTVEGRTGYLFALYDGTAWRYFNQDGSPVMETACRGSFRPSFESDASRFRPFFSTQNLIAVNTADGAGYYDINGNAVTGLVYDEARPVYQGRGWVRENGRWHTVQVGGKSERETKRTGTEAAEPTAVPAVPLNTATARPAKRSVHPGSLKRGSRGYAVSALQKTLMALGYLKGSADGDFGGKTEDAVKMAQTRAGLPASGVADGDFLVKLYSGEISAFDGSRPMPPPLVIVCEETSHHSESGRHYTVSNVFDDELSSCWAEGASGYGIGEGISFTIATFGRDTVSLRIYSGYHKSSQRYHQNGRPRDITLLVNDRPQTCTFADSMSPEVIIISNLDGDSFVEVKLTIDSVYNGSRWKDTCISEIEVF